MDSAALLHSPSSAELDVIYKELGIDANKIENNLKLLKEWLRCETHLPNHIDENLLRGFLRGCKGNLEKSKQKIEKYLVAKTKLTDFFHNRIIIDDDYVSYQIHRCVFVSNNYTNQGNRIIIYRLPTTDVTHFDYLKIVKYVLTLLDFLLHHDITAGYDFVYDGGNITGQVMSKLNFTAVKHLFDLFYNILPIRTRSIFVLNPNSFVDIVMTLAKSLMPKKIKERISNGKVEDLLKRYPKNCLPIEYGGTGGSADDLCDEYLKLFKNNRSWIENSESFKLIGPLPDHKKNLYSFEEFSMDGSFRKLIID